MPITPLPTPPSRQDPANFSARSDAFLGALPTFATEANATASQVNSDAAAAASSAAAAAASAGGATAASGVVKWVSGTTYAEGAAVWSPATFLTYRRKSAGAGTTDPSTDTTNWAPIAGTGNVSTSSGVTTVQGTATVGATVKLLEGSNNGTHAVNLRAPASVAADVTLTLPGTAGSPGQVMTTDGSGGLNFATLQIGGAETRTSSATLTNASKTVQTLDMAAFGSSIKLPDATTMSPNAGVFVLDNSIGKFAVGILDGANAVLGQVHPGDVVTMSLRSNATVGGSWVSEPALDPFWFDTDRKSVV